MPRPTADSTDDFVSDNPESRCPLAAGLAYALALRHLGLVRSLVHTAALHGKAAPEAIDLPSYEDIRHRYEKLVDEWASEPVRSPREALALVEFAGVVVADQVFDELMRESASPVGEERDRMHVLNALTGVARWLNEADIREHLSKSRQGGAA